MNALSSLFSGKKTYATAVGMIAIGVIGASGHAVPGFDPANSGQLIVEGLGFLFTRMGIAKAPTW